MGVCCKFAYAKSHDPKNSFPHRSPLVFLDPDGQPPQILTPPRHIEVIRQQLTIAGGDGRLKVVPSGNDEPFAMENCQRDLCVCVSMCIYIYMVGWLVGWLVGS